jgi:catechol 2,3-dioxygenase-like lactoylglutathione lyase family enzyme
MRLNYSIKAMLLCGIAFLFQACELKVKERPQKPSSAFSIDHYAINVVNLDNSVAFYQDLFDLQEIKNGTELAHIRWFRLGEAEELHIIQVDSLDKKIPKGVHIALRTNEFESFRESLLKKNIPYSDWPGAVSKVSTRPDGVKQLYIQDPDGYWIEVNDAQN